VLLLHFLINVLLLYLHYFLSVVFCYLFDAVCYLLRKVHAHWLEHPICEVDLTLYGSMKVEADKSVTRNLRLKWLYKLCVIAIRRPPIGMKYEVGEFDSELWKQSWRGQTKYSMAYEAYEVLLSMKSWSDTECEEVITLAGWCCVLSSQCTLKVTWSWSRKGTFDCLFFSTDGRSRNVYRGIFVCFYLFSTLGVCVLW